MRPVTVVQYRAEPAALKAQTRLSRLYLRGRGIEEVRQREEGNDVIILSLRIR